MTRPFVIDANAFKRIYEDLVSGVDGLGQSSLNLILEDDHILLDEKGRIRQEWKECSCGDADEYLSAWISQRLIEDKIRQLPVSVDRSLRSELVNFGMPNKDKVYFYTAASNSAYCIVSEDSDLYDPRAKNWGADRKRKLRESGKSPVGKYMRRHYAVEIFPLVLTSGHCPA